jgi:trk system potassium uptake protein TrkA
MRIVFVGASPLAIATARMLLARDHEVVVVDGDKAVIDALAEELDCGFLLGDGTRPAVLREVDPKGTDFLFCLTDNDQTNIIASLVGRSLGFDRVVTRVENEDFEHICLELGLTDTIVPDLTIARYLADIVAGQDIMELALTIKGDARVFSFVAGEEDEGPMRELGLPPKSQVVCLYRQDELLLPDDETRIKDGDEVVVLSHSDSLPALRERWGHGNNRLTADAVARAAARHGARR